ncbi:MAG: tyrosine-type recombinase/integrase [Burkholderiales bacterium]
MPPKRKPENKGLPARWTNQHGAFYYRVPKGLEALWDGKQFFMLGKTLPEAYKVWAERINAHEITRTVGQLLDRYTLEVVPTKAKTTQAGNLVFIRAVRAAFGALPLDAVKPKHIYQYVDARSAKISAHREIEVLSHAFTKAVQWGLIDAHPFKGEVRLEGEKPRTRYVEDWELVEALSLPSPRVKSGIQIIQSYLKIKLLTGLRRGDLLRLTMTDLQEDGIHVTPNKTANSSGKRLIIQWSDDLRGAVEDAKRVRPVLSGFLFCNRRGECHVNDAGQANGWDSMWQRFMDKVLTDTKVTERFTEHDIRAKCASDADSLEHARQLLAHTDSRMTERVYRRKPERVKPLR